MEEEKSAQPETEKDTLVHKKNLTPSQETVEEVRRLRSEADEREDENDFSKYGTIAKPVVDNAPPPKPAAKQAEKQENTSSSGPISTRVPAVLFYALYSLAANMFGFAQCVILLRDKSQSQSFTEFALLVSIVWMFMDIYLLFGRDKWNIIRFLRINAYLCALSIIIYALVFQIIGIALQVIMLLFLRNVMYRVGEEE